MVLPTGFADARARSAPLASRTSMGVGGTPEFLFWPRSAEEAAEVVSLCRRTGVPWHALGGGSNLLAADGTLGGAVILTAGLRSVVVRDDAVEVGAGFSFPRLVRMALDLGIPGLAGCPGIPGSAGGAAVMNAGGRHGSMGDALLEVEGVDERGRLARLAVEPRHLGYRETHLTLSLVTAVRVRRDPTIDPGAARRLYAEALAEKRRTQPLGIRSSGCIFRNPARACGAALSAGHLIDEAGLKGRRTGGAVVSRRHANFIVNEGGATATDVLSLLDDVRQAVRARTGIALEPEVHIWR